LQSINPEGGWGDDSDATMLNIGRSVTCFGHNLRHEARMVHSLLAGAVFVALVLTPCVIAMLSGVDEQENPR
jgi:hypothetical protein